MTEEERLNLSPEEVLREFFTSYANKNQHDMEFFLDQRHHGILWNLRNLKSLRLISIERTTDYKVEREINSEDGGNMIKQASTLGYQIETFLVTTEQIFFRESDSNWHNGELTETYILVKKTEDSPWEIYSFGFD